MAEILARSNQPGVVDHRSSSSPGRNPLSDSVLEIPWAFTTASTRSSAENIQGCPASLAKPAGSSPGPIGRRVGRRETSKVPSFSMAKPAWSYSAHWPAHRPSTPSSVIVVNRAGLTGQDRHVRQDSTDMSDRTDKTDGTDKTDRQDKTGQDRTRQGRT